jgi:hypothetical protein
MFKFYKSIEFKHKWKIDNPVTLLMLLKQQDAQCAYNVTLRRVHEATAAVEKQ